MVRGKKNNKEIIHDALLKKRGQTVTSFRRNVIKDTMTQLIDGDSVENKELIDRLVEIQRDKELEREMLNRMGSLVDRKEEK